MKVSHLFLEGVERVGCLGAGQVAGRPVLGPRRLRVEGLQAGAGDGVHAAQPWADLTHGHRQAVQAGSLDRRCDWLCLPPIVVVQQDACTRTKR